MPLPSRKEGESKENFLSRCMSNEKTMQEFKDKDQRLAVCMSKASEGLDTLSSTAFAYDVINDGYTEAINEDNFYVPSEEEYEDWGEETEEWDISVAKPGLWENIRRKKQREGDNYKPAKTVKEGRPTQEQLKRAQNQEYDSVKDFFEAEAKPSDPRRTPAPKKDQKRGSKRNKPDSAKNPSGKITFSKETTARLSKIVSEHNAKGKGSKATLGMLKAVYRRGAGAFSTSHAPKMSRDGWAMARVRAFIHLLRTGKPKNAAYTQDNDLLPKSHPKKSKSKGLDNRKKALDKNKDGKITKEDFDLLRKDKATFKYRDPKTGQVYEFERKGIYTKDGRNLIPLKAAEYQGRKVKLGKPFLTPNGPKKRSVYVKNEKGNVVKVNFGDPNMKIKKSDPARRKSFRSRHNCSNPGPRWKARYWS